MCIFPTAFHVLPKTNTSALLITLKLLPLYLKSTELPVKLLLFPNVVNSVINHMDLNCLANVSTVTVLLRYESMNDSHNALPFISPSDLFAVTIMAF